MCDSRHKCSSERLEEERNDGHHAGKVRPEPGANGQDAYEEGDDGEEEGDDVEGPSESAEVVVFVRANERARYTSRRAEVGGRAESLRSMNLAAVGIAAAVDAADGEVGPARGIGCAGDARGISLEEVDEVDGRLVDVRAGQDDEECQNDAAGEQDHRDQAEDGACDGHGEVLMGGELRRWSSQVEKRKTTEQRR